jgi:hypothetical protein
MRSLDERCLHIRRARVRSRGFDLAATLKLSTEYGHFVSRAEYIDHVVPLIWRTGSYVLVTAVIGLGAGCLVSYLASRGYLPFLIRHKWINQVGLSMKSGLVTAYVMTNTSENGRVLMYKGILAEFFQQPEGKFEYVVLKSCSRFFMTFEEAPTTGEQLQLFRSQMGRLEGVWDFLQIEGANIANILFDPSRKSSRQSRAPKPLIRRFISLRSCKRTLRPQG